MKAMPDDMIAIWVARYCVVTASQLMLIGKNGAMIYVARRPRIASSMLCGSVGELLL
jgi:hypothetical protein